MVFPNESVCLTPGDLFAAFCEYFSLIVVTYLDWHPNPLLGSLPGGQQRTLKIRTFSKVGNDSFIVDWGVKSVF